MLTVKQPAADRRRDNPFFPRQPADPAFLIGSLMVGLFIAGFVLVGLSLMGAF